MSEKNKTTTCKACNAEIDKKAKVCPYCGAKIKKPFYKRTWFIVVVVIVVIGIIGSAGSGSDNTEGTTSLHIYDNAEIKDVMNGTRTEKIGEYSVINISSDEVTEEALTDWYFNYVVENDYNWCMILYADKDDNMGVYSISGYVGKDVYFEEDSNGDYSLADSSQSIIYYPTEEGNLEIHNYDNADEE